MDGLIQRGIRHGATAVAAGGTANATISPVSSINKCLVFCSATAGGISFARLTSTTNVQVGSSVAGTVYWWVYEVGGAVNE